MKDIAVGCVIDTRWRMTTPAMLCVQRRADQNFPLKWSIPGGKIEPGESLFDAARRELEEELGIKPHFEINPYKVRLFEEYRLYYLRATEWDGEIQNKDQVPEVRWVTAPIAKTLDFLPDDSAVLRRVLYLCNQQKLYKVTTIAGKPVPVFLYCERTHHHNGQCRATYAGEKLFW